MGARSSTPAQPGRDAAAAAAAASAAPGTLPDTAFPPTLTIGTAVVMASAAMEAYLEPTSGQKFRGRGSNGTEIQYLDSEFVQTNLGALLEVTVKSAKGFSGADVRTTVLCAVLFHRSHVSRALIC